MVLTEIDLINIQLSDLKELNVLKFTELKDDIKEIKLLFVANEMDCRKCNDKIEVRIVKLEVMKTRLLTVIGIVGIIFGIISEYMIMKMVGS